MLDTLTLFGKYASALELTDAEKKNARDTMQRAEIGTDDPTVMWFCILAKFDALSKVANGDFVKTGKQLLAAMDNKLRENIENRLEGIELHLSAEARKFLEKEQGAIIQRTVDDMTSRLAEMKRLNTARLSLLRSIWGAMLFGLGFLVCAASSTSDFRLAALDLFRAVPEHWMTATAGAVGLFLGWLLWGVKKEI